MKLLQARGEIAVVFGDERAGLTAEEVEAVDLLSSIPSDPAQPSWNLAQAIAIYAYELRMASQAPRQPSPRPDADPAALAAVDRALAEATGAIGKPATRRRLFRALSRSSLSNRKPPSGPHFSARWERQDASPDPSLNHPAAAATSPSPTPSTQSSTASASALRSADLRAASIAAANRSVG